ncbi:LrgB family protein [Desulfovibrio cuneatus]|uniref:LrgB family protein n=1 Tax=Desulfovibrio cuneatus TaxID=159728 RepID=UPI0003F686C9|nr:LrgB family protein [Desulfovibrio cuneatus]
MQQLTLFFYIAFTLGVYALVRFLYVRSKNNPLFNIVAVSAAIIIAVLLACGITCEQYEPAKDIMTILLGPATVGLGLPLYRYRKLLRQQAGCIAMCVAGGALLAMFSAALIAQWGGLPHDVVMSIMVKGVSIPFAIEITGMYGGIPPLAAAFVVATGTFGSLVGSWFLTRVGVANPLGRGLALGTVSHAQGTAVALMEGEEQGAMAGLAMILAGIFTAAFAPPVVWVLQLLS